jgi:hypothetical protein
MRDNSKLLLQNAQKYHQASCGSEGSTAGSFEGGINPEGNSLLFSECGGRGKYPALGGGY